MAVGGKSGDGYFSRLVRRLTSDVEELDAEDLSEKAEASGAARVRECHSGEEVTILGRLRSVEMCPRDAVATLEAELFDGTDGVTLVWLGRRRIPGIEPGRTIMARGRIAERDGQKVLYNPYYELQQTS
ncbi:MAG: DNA-binding protein [Pseudonocardiaceae bacterium]|nr:DNA-binding protein [Pseudonocardiaceae bacterium]